MSAGAPAVDCALGHGCCAIVAGPVFDLDLGLAAPFAIARCPQCGLLQTAPRLGDDELAQLRARAEGEGEKVLGRGLAAPLAESALARAWARIDGDILFCTRRGTGRLIELGCGAGGHLVHYRANGFRAEGQESDPALAARARARGFRVDEAAPAVLGAAGAFDVVVLSDALGAAADPRVVLSAARRLLAPAGELWISVPHAGGLPREAFAGDWIGWGVPFRRCHFDAPALRRLAGEAGFEITALRTLSPAAGIARSIIARLYARPGVPTRRLAKPWLVAMWTVLVRGLMFPTLWLVNAAGRGDRLVARARKAPPAEPPD